MELEIRFNSIARQWILRVFTPIAVIVALLATVGCLSIRSAYHHQVKNSAEERTNGFFLLSGTERDYFASGAREYCEQFEYKDKIEVMILDHQGRVLVSTSGFERQDLVMPDYQDALQSEDGKGMWIGKSSAGEKVMAETVLLADTGWGSNGAVRWAVSLSACNRRITLATLLVMFVAVGMLSLTAVSGLFFIKSIAQPVRRVSATARLIAAGDYREELRADRNDEIGELCDSINYMEAELKNAETLKNDFISSVSHELRTPLTAIRGWAETAQMSIDSDTELVKRGLDVVLSETDRLSGLVEELLDFSRIQSGRVDFDLMPIGVTAILKEAADIYTEMAARRQIDITVTAPKEDSYVNGDKNRLKQVFVNIIDNAVKYTGERGQVLIEQTEEDGCVKITVKDTGVGIPAQDVDRVKEKFYKANKEVRGSGIGLAVADEIIKQHKGLLFLESTEGIGTTVTIVLPLYEPPVEPMATVIEPTNNDINPKTDPNESVVPGQERQLYNAAIENAGFKAIGSAEPGEERN